jgi:tRNA splicing ligase
LQQGAKHIYHCDKYATHDNKKNAKLLEKHGEYLYAVRENILPNPDFITLINEDIYSCVEHIKDLEVDLVLSSSVFEHLDDVDNATYALMKMTALNGIHIHFIDLRDHYFKYPFQMLCYSERTWKRVLNTENNLNRLRVRDYEKIFWKYFMDIQYKIIESDIDLYKKVKDKVMSEFIAGDDKIDSATKIVIIASKPLRIDRRCSK